LPVSVKSKGVGTFCRAQNATTASLVAAADALDVNVAVVDDRLELAVAGERISVAPFEVHGLRLERLDRLRRFDGVCALPSSDFASCGSAETTAQPMPRG
jgi:hypothetical protein